MNKPKLVILDYDGFFYPITWELVYGAYLAIMNEFKIFEWPWGEDDLNKFKQWYSPHYPDNLKKMHLGDEENSKIACNIFSQYMKENITEFFPEVWEFIALCKENNIAVGICSNSPSEGIIEGFEEEELEFFDCILGPDLVEGVMKPKPDGLQMCMQTVGAEPSETIMMGDHDYDMGAAVAAQVIGWAGAFGMSDSQSLAQAGATKVFDSWRSIIEQFKKDFLE